MIYLALATLGYFIINQTDFFGFSVCTQLVPNAAGQRAAGAACGSAGPTAKSLRITLTPTTRWCTEPYRKPQKVSPTSGLLGRNHKKQTNESLRKLDTLNRPSGRSVDDQPPRAPNPARDRVNRQPGWLGKLVPTGSSAS